MPKNLLYPSRPVPALLPPPFWKHWTCGGFAQSRPLQSKSRNCGSDKRHRTELRFRISKQGRYIFLLAKNAERLNELKEFLISQKSKTNVIDKGLALETIIKDADIIIFTTSAIEVPSAATADNLKKGAIICDIPSPRNISKEICEHRKDILVIDGAVIEPPPDSQNRIKAANRRRIYLCLHGGNHDSGI